MLVALAQPLAAADDPALDTVIVTVNGTQITLGELLIARSQLPPQYSQLAPEALFDGLVTQLVQQQLLADQLTEVPARLDMALRNETRSLRAGEVVNALVNETVSETAIQELYAEQFGAGDPEQEFNAAHILVETEDEAKAIIAELQDGADFAELAKEKSTGPSGPSGGELGWFTKGMMVPAFEEAALALEPGAISAPVETQFGWHVIKFHEAREKAVPGLEDVRDQLTQQATNAAITDHIEALEKEADISRNDAISPDVLTHTDLLD